MSNRIKFSPTEAAVLIQALSFQKTHAGDAASKYIADKLLKETFMKLKQSGGMEDFQVSMEKLKRDMMGGKIIIS